MDLNIFTALCYLPLFPAVIIPCVIALNTTTDKPEDLRFAAVQSLILNGGFFALNAVLSGVMGVFAMIPIVGGLINFGLGIVMAVLIVAYILVSLKLVVSAYSGQKFAVPFIAPYAEKYSSPS
ncbi:MAG: hypothetical protein JSS86_02290 [Cyanobacteria bacterium SZAS LIN-2]|nr:hypothetical protein [Cyanobacteria bacterium SZAS LIN-2]